MLVLTSENRVQNVALGYFSRLIRGRKLYCQIRLTVPAVAPTCNATYYSILVARLKAFGNRVERVPLKVKFSIKSGDFGFVFLVALCKVPSECFVFRAGNHEKRTPNAIVFNGFKFDQNSGRCKPGEFAFAPVGSSGELRIFILAIIDRFAHFRMASMHATKNGWRLSTLQEISIGGFALVVFKTVRRIQATWPPSPPYVFAEKRGLLSGRSRT